MSQDSPFNESPPITDRETYQQWYDTNSHFSNRGMSSHAERLFWLLPLARGHTLEVGCQWGGVTEHLLMNNQVTLVDAIDITVKHVEETIKYISTLPFALRSKLVTVDQEYLEDLYIKSYVCATDRPPAYDTIALFEVLEHVLDPITALVACKNMMKCPGGRLLISVPNGNCFQEPDHLRVYTEEILIADIEKVFDQGEKYVWQVVTTPPRPGTNFSWILAVVELGNLSKERRE